MGNANSTKFAADGAENRNGAVSPAPASPDFCGVLVGAQRELHKVRRGYGCDSATARRSGAATTCVRDT